MQLQGKKVIALGERDGIQEAPLRSAPPVPAPRWFWR